MMQLVLPRSWKEEFAQAAAAKREETLYWEQMRQFAAHERERRKQQRDEEKRDREERAILEVVLATFEQVATFRVEIDDYDAKTVESLMENREALDTVHRRIYDMLAKAEVLPDGRRVFKTMDGKQVFDEHGQEIAADIIDPNSIDDKKPRWETFKAEKEAEIRLNQERQQLLDYQARLDEARDRLDKGEITDKELKEMKAELTATMPEAVRQKLERDDPEGFARSKPEAVASRLPDNMDNLMRQTGTAPSPM